MSPRTTDSPAEPTEPGVPAIAKTDEQWRSQLTAEQYRILRQKGTEAPFTGQFHQHHEPGTYLCGACGQRLFGSDAKFDSGSGWPSFFRPVVPGSVATHADRNHGMVRTEVTCSRCGSHLGHVFDDGPRPTGLRYCINSGALQFRKAQ